MSANLVPVQTPDPRPDLAASNDAPGNNMPPEQEQHSWWTDLLEQNSAFALTWALSAGIGAFAISASRGIAMPRLGVPILIMVFYGWVGYQRANLASTPMIRAARVGQLADSLYFLGFLWTLWALIDSFVFKQMSASEAVFRTFGYALVTTALGMFFRLLLVQFMYSGADQHDYAEHELEKQMGRFSDAVSRSVLAVNILKKGLEDVETENRKNLDQLAGKAKSLLQEFANSTSALLKPSLTSLADSINDYTTNVQTANTTFQNSSTSLRRSLQKNIDAMESAVGCGQKSITDGTDKMVSVLSAATSSVGVQTANFGVAVSGVASEIATQWQICKGTMLKSATEMQASTTSLTAHVSAAGQAVDEVEQGVRLVARKIDAIRVSPDLIEASVERRITGALAALQKAVNALNGASESLTKATVTTHSENGKGFWSAMGDRMLNLGRGRSGR